MDDLYFIEARGGRIKIGRAKDPQKRLKALQTASPDTLELLVSLDGRGYEERTWHSAFRDYRQSGEWFTFNGELDAAMTYAMDGKPWWDHLTPPADIDVADDPDERDDDYCDWQIAVHLALVGAAEKAGLSPRMAGTNLYDQDNAPSPLSTLSPSSRIEDLSNG